MRRGESRPVPSCPGHPRVFTHWTVEHVRGVVGENDKAPEKSRKPAVNERLSFIVDMS